MEIPAKIRIPLCIEQGCVFNFLFNFGDSKRESKNRYFVVLNSSPKTDSVLVMVTSTTQILKKEEFIKRAHIGEKTLVRVTHAEYPTFSQDSVFNCNTVIEVKIKDLVRKIEENGSMNYPKIPADVLRKLVEGVHKSPRIDEALKKLI